MKLWKFLMLRILMFYVAKKFRILPFMLVTWLLNFHGFLLATSTATSKNKTRLEIRQMYKVETFGNPFNLTSRCYHRAASNYEQLNCSVSQRMKQQGWAELLMAEREEISWYAKRTANLAVPSFEELREKWKSM